MGSGRWSDAVDPSRVEVMQMDDVIEQTRQSLASVVGQGLPEAGVPAHLMISVPDPAREGELETARQVLRAPALAADRARAHRAYEDFMSVAQLSDPGAVTWRPARYAGQFTAIPLSSPDLRPESSRRVR